MNKLIITIIVCLFLISIIGADLIFNDSNFTKSITTISTIKICELENNLKLSPQEKMCNVNTPSEISLNNTNVRIDEDIKTGLKRIYYGENDKISPTPIE